jgi:hypothetical protein
MRPIAQRMAAPRGATLTKICGEMAHFRQRRTALPRALLRVIRAIAQRCGCGLAFGLMHRIAAIARGRTTHAKLWLRDPAGSRVLGMVCCKVALRQTISNFSRSLGLRHIAVGIIV